MPLGDLSILDALVLCLFVVCCLIGWVFYLSLKQAENQKNDSYNVEDR